MRPDRRERRSGVAPGCPRVTVNSPVHCPIGHAAGTFTAPEADDLSTRTFAADLGKFVKPDT